MMEHITTTHVHPAGGGCDGVIIIVGPCSWHTDGQTSTNQPPFESLLCLQQGSSRVRGCPSNSDSWRPGRGGPSRSLNGKWSSELLRVANKHRDALHPCPETARIANFIQRCRWKIPALAQGVCPKTQSRPSFCVILSFALHCQGKYCGSSGSGQIRQLMLRRPSAASPSDGDREVSIWKQVFSATWHRFLPAPALGIAVSPPGDVSVPMVGMS